MPVSRELRVHRPGGRSLALDVYDAAQPGPRPCVILLHGGGWMFGSRADMAAYAQELASHGFTAIAAEYRLLGEAPWPAQIQDVKDTIASVRTLAAELQIDASKIALGGFSAGGHLALLAATTPGQAANGETSPTTPTDVAAVVAFFAPALLRLPPLAAGPNPVAALLGANAGASALAAASPITHVSADCPPMFLLNGTRDPMVPHQVALDLFAALDRVGVAADLHLYHGQTHEFAALPSMLAPVQAEVVHFLRRAMVDPEFYARENAALNPFASGRPPGVPAPAPAA